MMEESIHIAIAQVSPTPGAPRRNVDTMIAYIADAKRQGANLIVFPELVTSGYLLGDRWEQDAFIEEMQDLDEEIRLASNGIVVVWGSVKSHPDKIGEDGRLRKYNVARIASNGEWVSNGVLHGWIPKTNLPKYRIFDDARHFYPSDKLAQEMHCSVETLLRAFPVVIAGRAYRLALTICEDLWEDEYHTKLSRIYGAQEVDLMIDISASPWTQGKHRARDRMLEKRVRDSRLPILYVNRCGLENNVKNLVWFDGDSALIDSTGTFRFRAPQHEEGLFFVSTTDSVDVSEFPNRSADIEITYDALIHAMRAFFVPFKKVVIGLSGGIDSAVSAALVSQALGADRVIAVNMPTVFNSQTTQDLARQCAANLGIAYFVVPIQNIVDTITQTVAAAGFPEAQGLALENLQARVRGADIQALVAQLHEGAFICNGNKTEMALNYFTLYGDGAGAAAFLADLWKGQIYELAHYINVRAESELIPRGIIEIVPSAELSSNQNVDEGKGDPIFYPYHDKLLLAFTESRWDPTTVLKYAIEETLEEKLGCASGTIRSYFATRAAFIENLEWAWRCYSTEFKRAQTPPVFLTSRRAFGFDRRDTIAEGYLTGAYGRLKQQYLSNPFEHP